MSTDSVSQFETSVQGLVDDCVRTPPGEFSATISDVVEEPAVGVELGFDDVSLDGTPVTVEPTVEELEAATTGVTAAGMGIANYGTVTVRSSSDLDELVSLYPPRHVVVLAASDVVADMSAAFDRLDEEFEAGRTTQVFATGTSSTADMGTLVQGVHGPKHVTVVIVEGR